MERLKLNKKGFTLAETLITLGIIGVVAAITIPMIITKYQKQVTVEKLKKMYNNMNSIMQMAVNDNGDMSTWDFSEQSLLNANSNFYKTYINSYLKTIKRNRNHINNSSYTTCIYNIHGNILFQDASWQILPDGTSIALFNNSGGGYFWIFTDITGPKRPNRLGKDIFMMDLDVEHNKVRFECESCNDSLIMSTSSSYYGCNKMSLSGFAGGNCGAKILKDGWKISDDYPW